jgi:hypothetical protein
MCVESRSLDLRQVTIVFRRHDLVLGEPLGELSPFDPSRVMAHHPRPQGQGRDLRDLPV